MGKKEKQEEEVKPIEKMTTEELLEEVKKLNLKHEQYIGRLGEVGKKSWEFTACRQRALEANRALSALCVYLLELK